MRRHEQHARSHPSARHCVRLILQTMVDPTRTLTDLLLVLDTLEYPTRPHVTINRHVSVQHTCSVRPLLVAFLACRTTCHLQSWRMVVRGRLPLRTPAARWAPQVMFLVRPDLGNPFIAHLLQGLPGLLLVLTSAPAVHDLHLLADPDNFRMNKSWLLLETRG